MTTCQNILLAKTPFPSPRPFGYNLPSHRPSLGREIPCAGDEDAACATLYYPNINVLP